MAEEKEEIEFKIESVPFEPQHNKAKKPVYEALVKALDKMLAGESIYVAADRLSHGSLVELLKDKTPKDESFVFKTRLDRENAKAKPKGTRVWKIETVKQAPTETNPA